MKKHENKFHVLNQDFIDQAFTSKKVRRSFWHFVLYALVFILIFALVFVIANFSSLSKQFSYWYEDNYKSNKIDTKLISLEASLNNETATEEFVNSNAPTFNDNHIYIPEIDVNDPIIWNVQNVENETTARLEDGTIHLAGTALPGQNGNVFVTGHSSNYIWSPGSFKDVFSLLNRLVIGDFVYLKYQNKIYAYKIGEIKVVDPTDLSVLNQAGESRLTLMTCTPVGTTLNRLILVADQVFPNSDSISEDQNISDFNSLPPIK